MNTHRHHHSGGIAALALALATVLTWQARPGLAQGIGTLPTAPTSPTFSTPGIGGPSFGFGTLNRGGAGGASGGILGRSIPIAPTATPKGKSAGGQNLGVNLNSQVLYKPNAINVNTSARGSAAQGFSEMQDRRVLLGQSLMGAFGLSETTIVKDKPLTSFAPDNRGQFASAIRAGEDAMKIRQYVKAEAEFLKANSLNRRSPETLLALAHANFAQGNFAMTSHYLRMAIRYFPELPLVDIRLRKFFRNSAEFIALRSALQDRTNTWPNDGSLYLALAYIQWFDGNTADAASALRTGLRVSSDPAVTDTIEEFWEGCLASGKITGSLVAPTPTSRPARRTSGAVTDIRTSLPANKRQTRRTNEATTAK